jgi:hypothetical protein
MRRRSRSRRPRPASFRQSAASRDCLGCQTDVWRLRVRRSREASTASRAHIVLRHRNQRLFGRHNVIGTSRRRVGLDVPAGDPCTRAMSRDMSRDTSLGTPAMKHGRPSMTSREIMEDNGPGGRRTQLRPRGASATVQPSASALFTRGMRPAALTSRMGPR